MADSYIYLDHAATSWPKPIEVVQETTRALTDVVANAGRSGHQASLAAARTVFETRKRLAELIGATRSEDLVFVRGCTEGLNLVLQGWLSAESRVAVTPLEHNAVMRPLVRLQRERGIIVETLPADGYGRVDLEAARRLAHERHFDLLIATHASNVNGAVQELGALQAAFAGTPLLVDAAQTAGVLPLDVQRQRIDFLTFSGHKGLLGPTGVGACYLSPDQAVAPLQLGGTGSQSESLEHPGFRPDCYEPGTLNIHGIAGTRGALLGLADRGLLGPHKRALCQLLIDELAKLPAVRTVSPRDGSALCVSFTIEGMTPDAVALRLERQFGILCRPGLQCAPTAHRHFGTYPSGTVRLSPGWGNTEQHMEAAAHAVRAIAQTH